MGNGAIRYFLSRLAITECLDGERHISQFRVKL